MSEHKHTPGPWGNHLVDDTVVVIPRRPLSQQISVLGQSEVADDEDYANARLIAAAPELLEILQVIVADSRWVSGEPLLSKARAAIAKAIGATHE